jgi:hypothetical protein
VAAPTRRSGVPIPISILVLVLRLATGTLIIALRTRLRARMTSWLLRTLFAWLDKGIVDQSFHRVLVDLADVKNPNVVLHGIYLAIVYP